MSEFKLPVDNHNFRWTNHVVRKMGFYGLTPSRVLRVIRAPHRVEEGVAVGALAAMQTAGSKAHPWELWVMWAEEKKPLASSRQPLAQLKAKSYQLEASRKVIITAWRYPGVSPIREKVPIPSDILADLESEGILD